MTTIRRRGGQRDARIAAKVSRHAVLLALVGAAALTAQQRSDPDFDGSVAKPLFAPGAGPVVSVDAAHQNFHTATGRYRTFADVLTSDGFQVREHRTPFTPASLRDVSILVIANAGTDSTASWSLPTRSAFSPDEIDALEAWVRGGGALFLISDHMPAAGATADLARRFGAQFTNGYSFQTRLPDYPGDLFARADSTLLDHPVTRGRSAGERIDSIVSFTGQAFQVDQRLRVVLRFGPTGFSYLPVRAGAGFDSTTPRLNTGGWAHAAVGDVGAGRVALVGEAAMFSAQLAGPRAVRMGMNNPLASRNKQFLLNLVHWLAGRLEPAGSGPRGL